jgi:hypothetical protein
MPKNGEEDENLEGENRDLSGSDSDEDGRPLKVHE